MRHVEKEREDSRVQAAFRAAKPAAGWHRERCLPVLQRQQPPAAQVVNRRLRGAAGVDPAQRLKPGQREHPGG
jgi:hypothetical protein